MIKHFKRLLNDIVQLKTFKGVSGSGVKEYNTPVDVHCYIATEVINIIDEKGEAAISTIQLYMDGENPLVTLLKTVDIFTIDRDYVIKKIRGNSDGRGASSLLVVYI